MRRCLGFARCADEQRRRMIGWYCNAGPNMIDHATIACALDRLTLQSAAGDPQLQDFFARAKRAGPFCDATDTQVATASKRADWIDPDPKPRGGFAGR